MSSQLTMRRGVALAPFSHDLVRGWISRQEVLSSDTSATWKSSFDSKDSEAMVLDTIVGFPFVLTVVVFFHEFGHFLVARWCGVGVKAFSIGFGPEIFGFTDKYGTRWKVSWIPLGGYVKFIDDENVASASGRKTLERLSPEERRQSFQEKPLAARAAVVAAGPIANFVLAIAIFTAIFALFGERITAAKVDVVNAGSAAALAGFMVGDKVVSIDGQAIESFGEMQRI